MSTRAKVMRRTVGLYIRRETLQSYINGEASGICISWLRAILGIKYSPDPDRMAQQARAMYGTHYAIHLLVQERTPGWQGRTYGYRAIPIRRGVKTQYGGERFYTTVNGDKAGLPTVVRELVKPMMVGRKRITLWIKVVEIT